jgi:hypothetical protein
MTITTPLSGGENPSTRQTRLKAIYDWWYGSGAYVAAGTLGPVRAGLNDRLPPPDIANGESFGSWLIKVNMLNDPLGSSPALLAPILSPAGRKGALWDFSRAETVWEDTAATDPAELDDPIAALTARSVGNLASATFVQSTIGARPTRKAAFAEFDGGDDMSGDTNARNILRNVGHGLLASRVRFDFMPLGTRGVINFTVDSFGLSRFLLGLTALGRVQVSARRVTEDDITSILSPEGSIVLGVDYNLLATVDYVNGGASAMRLFLDGVEVATGALSGTGNTEDITSQQARIGGIASAGTQMTGRIYRTVAIGSDTPFTAGERAIINGILTGA